MCLQYLQINDFSSPLWAAFPVSPGGANPRVVSLFPARGAKTPFGRPVQSAGWEVPIRSGVIRSFAPRQTEGEKALGNHSTGPTLERPRSRSTCGGSTVTVETCSDL